METQAPAVVALVVASQSDHHLDETLRSLVAQDYASLQTLVLLGPDDAAAASRVATLAPSFLVTHLAADRGFGAAINHGVAQVEGAAFFLLCHDDVVLAPDVVHLMVEESFRSNAAIVTPKMVSAADTSVLLHVGQSVDRLGTIVERVQPGEIDQGQHDAVRDVFIAPGGVTLIRADLLKSLGGFDERYVALGDDLELCWRARLAGARLVCAPQAVVAHAERLAAGDRLLPDLPELEGVSLSRLRRRNELRTLVTSWKTPQRLLSLGLLAVLNLAEALVAAIGGDHDRAVDIREAWRVAFRERRLNRQTREKISKTRTVSDRTIRSFQSHGATRLRAFLTTFLHHGYDAARGILPAQDTYDDADEGSEFVGFGGAFSDDEGFDELDDLGHRGHRRRGQRLFSSARTLFFVVAAAVVVFVIGSRNLVGTRLPMIGQLVPLGSLGTIWHQVFASWQPSGLGNGAPGHPAYATLGLFGIVALGQMGAVVRLLLLLAIPVGALGVFRFLRPVASNRARVLAVLAFGGIALGANEIAVGSLSGLVALAVTPFLLRRLFRLARVVPFDEPFPPAVPFATRGWRRSQTGQVVTLGLLLALSSSLAPALLVETVVTALALSAASFLQRGRRPFQGQRQIFLGLLLALVLLAPLVITALLGGTHSLAVFGAASGPWSQPGLGGLLRFAVGPNGGGVLAWLLPLAAVVPLLIARGERLTLSAYLAAVAMSSLALALWVARGGWGSFAPDLYVVLAPAATSVALLVGLGLASLENDLSATRFTWRQLVASLGIACALIGLLPALGSAGNGRWKMPTSGYGDALSFLSGSALAGHRLLWLGDPRAIPGSSWPLEPGLAWSTSTGGLPAASNLFQPPTATAASAITTALDDMLQGKTVRLGQILAPTGISVIVVTSGVAPSVLGAQTGLPMTPPAALLPALAQQRDLVSIPGEAGVSVFENPQAMSLVATRSTPLTSQSTSSQASSVQGWKSSQPAGSLHATVTTGSQSLYRGFAPASDFGVSPSGGTTPAFGWAATDAVQSGPVTVSLQAIPYDALINFVMVCAWLAVALALLGRHRWLDWWWPKSRRERREAAQRSAASRDEFITLDEVSVAASAGGDDA